MLQLSLHGVRRILCLGAHSDDIEIGAGGTLLTLIEANPEVEIRWVVFSAPGERTAEANASAKEYLAPLKKEAQIQIPFPSFPESYFPAEWPNVKRYLEEEIRAKFEPDLIFTHYRDDRHQDHRVLSDLAWNTFRNHLILEYEIPKYDGDFGRPNLFVPLSPETAALKVKLLLKHFQTQRAKHWFTEETFRALLRLRGIEIAALYAEAFYARKFSVK